MMESSEDLFFIYFFKVLINYGQKKKILLTPKFWTEMYFYLYTKDLFNFFCV